jgi:hypothetical protein
MRWGGGKADKGRWPMWGGRSALTSPLLPQGQQGFGSAQAPFLGGLKSAMRESHQL